MNVKVVFGIFWIFSMCISDELIDDFERGVTQNYRQLDWYYFSDVKDGGNSVIKNAEQLSNGSYSKFIPGEDINSNKCVVVKYRIGNKRPDNGSYRYSNFVGVGTDLAAPGHIVDLSSATGITFQAKAERWTDISFEIVTSNIYDYNYYCIYFEVEKRWKTFTISLKYNDLRQRNDVDNAILDWSKVQKINWIFQHGCSIYEDADIPGDSGTVYIDNVKIIGNIESKTTILPQRISTDRGVNHQLMYVSDLLGRRIVPENNVLSAGYFLDVNSNMKNSITKTINANTFK